MVIIKIFSIMKIVCAQLFQLTVKENGVEYILGFDEKGEYKFAPKDNLKMLGLYTNFFFQEHNGLLW
ncbi:hypothetical protein A0H76_2992, partial [Hepatospora eriocheir]